MRTDPAEAPTEPPPATLPPRAVQLPPRTVEQQAGRSRAAVAVAAFIVVALVIAGGVTLNRLRQSRDSWQGRELAQQQRADGLDADLRSTKVTLSDTKGQLSSAQSQLADVQTQLAAAQSQVVVIKGQLTDVQAQLATSAANAALVRDWAQRASSVGSSLSRCVDDSELLLTRLLSPPIPSPNDPNIASATSRVRSECQAARDALDRLGAIPG